MERSRIYLSPPFQTGDELAALENVLSSNWLAPSGPDLEEFEHAICHETGFEYAVATSSGTAALHLALLVLGVSEGDSVLASTLTFVGSINPIKYLGATPIFVDSVQDSWNIDPALAEKYLDENPGDVKAIVPTHLFGMPADVKSLESMGKSNRVPVIHDLAECLGGRVESKKMGSLAERGILSFNGNKLISTAGGGAFVTNDQSEAEKALYLATQAKTDDGTYYHKTIGYNYRMSNVLAALGLVQLKSIQSRIERKREIFERYKHALEPLGYTFQLEPASIRSDRWLSVVLGDKDMSLSVDERVMHMDKSNIEVRPVWRPMHLQPVFDKEKVLEGSVSEDLFSRGLCLPSGCGLTEAQQDFVIEQMKSFN